MLSERQKNPINPGFFAIAEMDSQRESWGHNDLRFLPLAYDYERKIFKTLVYFIIKFLSSR